MSCLYQRQTLCRVYSSCLLTKTKWKLFRYIIQKGVVISIYYTANILLVKKTQLFVVFFFHVLPLPSGHLITVPSTGNNLHFQLYFWRKKSYHTDCCSYTETSVKIFQKIQLFMVFKKYNFFVVFCMHIFAMNRYV